METFWKYLEYRAPPKKPLLHYNSWFDMRAEAEEGLLPVSPESLSHRISTFGERTHSWQVPIKSFLIDGLTQLPSSLSSLSSSSSFISQSSDGWDSLDGRWTFNPKFPRGFSDLSQLAAKYGAGTIFRFFYLLFACFLDRLLGSLLDSCTLFLFARSRCLAFSWRRLPSQSPKEALCS